MADVSTRSPRRSDALSRERIVADAVEILDLSGDAELTVRGLSAHLATGRGPLYHHVAGKDELLAAATDHVMVQALSLVQTDGPPETAIRSLALCIFDTVDAHPWVGTQLVREPTQDAVLRIWTSIGIQLRRLGVEASALSDAGSAIVSYVLGSTAQHIAGPRTLTDEADRQIYLDQLAATWIEHDPDPLVAEVAIQLRDHDDREQFLAGVDIFLNGTRR